MAPTPSRKKAEASGKKKRSRKEVEEDDEESVDDSKASKKQNTSKTPVRHASRPSAMATVSSTLVDETNPSVDRSALQPSEETTETVELPPPDAADMIPTSKSSAPEPSPKAIQEPVIKESTNSTVSAPVGEPAETDLPVQSRRYWRYWQPNVILVFLLAFCIASWIFDHLNSQLTIGELRLEVQNRRALQSQQRKQDEYYIQELETQTRVWKRNAKAKDVELEALKAQCQGS